MSSAAKRRPIVGGNWKCNRRDVQAARADREHQRVRHVEVRRVRLPVAAARRRGATTGKFTNGAHVTPQNCNFTGCGAYTGEMAVDQMADMGISSGCSSATRSAAASSACRRQGVERAPRDEAGVHPREGPQLRLLHRRAAADPREGDRRAVLAECVNQLERHQGDARPVARGDRVRAGVGDRHRRHRVARAGAGDARRHPQVDRQERGQAESPTPSASSTAARRTPRTRPTSRRSPTSTASSSAAPRSSPSSPTSSRRSPPRKREAWSGCAREPGPARRGLRVMKCEDRESDGF